MNTPHEYGAMTHLHVSPNEWQDLVSTIRAINARLENIETNPATSRKTGITKDSQQEFFYTLKEAAKLLRVSLPTLGSYIKKGKIEARFIDRRVLIPVDSIVNFGKNLHSSDGRTNTGGGIHAANC